MHKGSVRQFLGLAYAEPPVGRLRYRDPVIKNSYNGDEPYDATSYRSSCMQYLDDTFDDFLGSDMWNAKNPLSEDCLYLNVWVPDSPPKDRKPRPIMVWVYGGGFYSGSNELWVYDGKALADHGDVIVAAMNYRVGSFGFLSTGDGRIRGNFGLKDQQTALRWIKNNAAGFGGDPDQITLFGESAGSASVGYHLLSESSADLFQRAIMQSASPDSFWSFMTAEKAESRSAKLFANIGCANDENILDCLQSKPAQEIFDNEWVVENFLNIPWVPSVDGDFLVAPPESLLEQGRFQHKDLLVGANKDEGTYFILYDVPGLSKDGPSPLNDELYKNGVDVVAWDLPAAGRAEVATFYKPPGASNGDANTAALGEIAGDRSFTCPVLDFAAQSAPGARTFVYHFTYRASNEVWPEWMGVIHAAEIQWIFGMSLNTTRGYNNDEIQLSKVMMDYWVNFAKKGNPSDADAEIEWPEFTGREGYYLEIAGASNFRIGSRFKVDECNLWRAIRVTL
ncbi:hypothetical protein CAPTEDRAFT_157584 [Capitella teleta]|uniref:Carboxylic ester hydrolase n=1 Tax=Capitella teleta TaxID=283909 RepID=R7U0C1_CAPTE|nr:hypothetical protein CAPTEDRAFT_157584 [Capitella teleta]|eukprot:ELT99434.1 hypothetical protein CAPTEDRAFT_157584 [Capitella teleta]